MRYTLPALSPIDVIRALTTPDAPVLLDVRLPEDVADHPALIPTAIPVDYTDVDTQADLARAAGAIANCHKGLKLSAGVTARLLGRGLSAWRITGGHMAWLDASLPVTRTLPPTAIVLALDATAAEVAAAWAALRFTAPRAELLEVPRADLAGVAERFQAALPHTSDAPALPGLLPLLDDVSQPDSLFHAQRAGAGARPSAAFACLDAAYRGRLDALHTDQNTDQTPARAQEARA